MNPGYAGGKKNPTEPLSRNRLRRIERREWGLWATAVVITGLLTAGLASFLAPLLRSSEGWEARFTLQQAVAGLVGVVLLFDLYSIYQQLQIHRIRRQLFESEELFRLISENAADLIAVVDMEGRRIYNSLSYQTVLGYSAEELKHSSGLEQIHPDDHARVREASAEARRTGKGRTLEYRIRHKDGSWRVLESTASVILDRKGQPEKLVIVNRDITERKSAVDALERSEASFRGVVEGAPYGICRVSQDGCFLRVNPALEKMLGHEGQEELLRSNIGMDVFRNLRDFEQLIEVLQSEGEFKDVEAEWKRKDGAPITVLCSGRSVDRSGNGLPSIELFAEDVTERRILERQLRMTTKMEAIGRLSGGIAHDFNNLLGVIIGYSEILKRKLAAENPLFECADEIEKAGQRAVSLTRQLLAFSRQQILSPAVLDLNVLVAGMEKMLPRLIGEDIAVQTSLSSEIGRVKADHGQIEQVVMNLAVNARDAMPQGGELRIETSNAEFDEAYVRHHPGAKRGRYVMLAVADTGIGMTAETLVHIFEPFFTTKEVGKGTGLGLATVYGVVKQSGGYLWVDSAPGKGSRFQMFLPRVEENVTDVVLSAAPLVKLRGAETILLVEDADALRKLARSFLVDRGFEVLAAPNGEEALRLAAGHKGPIHLLLTDVIMPGMNGRVLAEHLSPKRVGIRVLYMSGYTDSFIAGHGVLEAGTHLLHKPFTEEALITKVRDVLDAAPATLVHDEKLVPVNSVRNRK
jgi:two-component system cell cycle sensor histidine kinase/response regulator CckA